MRHKNKLFAILAIFCVIFSACAVCATDSDDAIGINETYDDVDYDDGYDDVAVDESAMYDIFDGTQRSINITEAPNSNDAAQNQTAVNPTNATNADAHAAGSDVANTTNATNTSVNHGLPATGNPIIALLSICAVLGGTAIYKRK